MDRVGEYTWSPGVDHWEWNDTMFHLLGYVPGQVRPSRALVIAHKHPADRAQVEHVLADACSNRLAYTHRHRIVSVTGEIHEVGAIGYPVASRSPSLLLHGYLVHLATHQPSPSTARAAGASARPPQAPSPASAAGPPTVPFTIPDPTTAAPWTLDPGREHDRFLVRAVDVLADATELPHGAAAALVAHLANTGALPLISVAERILAMRLDPDVDGLGGLLAAVVRPDPTD
ncbi:PAS domain-containing protein [Actinomycetospora chiangmaiensis]|uniref:PAS domain-containing protein n=1 Tax=Actinomycetospora chiangmaiensis TaxID=402650 RepID=UPI00035D0CD2|nr:PAS domain-containing protein [Actinomycetospora chiangmaiensis]